MTEVLYLYGNNKQIISQVELDETETDLECYVVPLYHDPLLRQLHSLRENGLNHANKLYKLDQSEAGLYKLSELFYVYFDSSDNKIVSISQIELSNYEEEKNISRRFVKSDDNIEKIFLGELSTVHFLVTNISDDFCELEKQEFDVEPQLPESFAEHKINFSKNYDAKIIYDRKRSMLCIDGLIIVNRRFWFYITKKNDQTILIPNKSRPRVRSKKIFIKVENLPKEFDLYSNLDKTIRYGFMEI